LARSSDGTGVCGWVSLEAGVSAIHNALSQTDNNEAQSSSSRYNPLSRAPNSTVKFKNPVYYGLAFAFLLGAAGLFLWPSQTPNSEIQTDTQMASTVTLASEEQEALAPTNSGNDIVSTNQAELPEASTQATSTDSELVNIETAQENTPLDTDKLPSTLDSLVIPELEVQPSKTETVIASVPKTAKTIEPAVIKSAAIVANEQDKDIAESSNATNRVKPNATQSSVTSSSGPDSSNTTTTGSTQSQSVVTRSVSNWQNQTEQFIENGELEKAEAILKQWIGALPKDPTPRIWLAKIYVNNGIYRAAEPLIQGLDNAEAKGLLGIVYERTQQPARAAKVFESLYREQSNQGKWLLFWAINEENSGQFAKSAALYQNYLKVFSLDDAKLTSFAENRLNVTRGQ
jgi:hypothetical protein